MLRRAGLPILVCLSLFAAALAPTCAALDKEPKIPLRAGEAWRVYDKPTDDPTTKEISRIVIEDVQGGADRVKYRMPNLETGAPGEKVTKSISQTRDAIRAELAKGAHATRGYFLDPGGSNFVVLQVVSRPAGTEPEQARPQVEAPPGAAPGGAPGAAGGPKGGPQAATQGPGPAVPGAAKGPGAAAPGGPPSGTAAPPGGARVKTGPGPGGPGAGGQAPKTEAVRAPEQKATEAGPQPKKGLPIIPIAIGAVVIILIAALVFMRRK